MEQFWTISGVIIGAVGLIIAYLQLVQKPNKAKRKSEQRVKQNLAKSNLSNSNLNSVQGENVNFNQTIINHVRDNINEKENLKKDSDIHIPDFEKAKRKIERDKVKLRTYIYAIIASAKSNNLHEKLEVRHVQDAIEELIEVPDRFTLEELCLMKEENIIDLFEKGNSEYIGPYTKIIIQKKFYDLIRPKQ